MTNSGRYALKTLAIDSTSRRRTGAPGLVITAVSANTSAVPLQTRRPAMPAPPARVQSSRRTTATSLHRRRAQPRLWRRRWAREPGGSARTRRSSNLPRASLRSASTRPRPGGKMLEQIPGEQRENVQRRAAALADAMRAIGICHEVERLVERDQAVHQPFRALVMHVVVAGAMHDQQASLEPLGLIDRRGTLVTRAVRRAGQEPHVALLINRVVETLIRDGRHGHADLVDVGVPKHRLQRARSAAAPAPD